MIGKFLRAALFAFALGVSVCFSVVANAEILALVGGSVYASPDAAPLPDAVIVVTDGVITAIGSRNDVSVPTDARIIDCAGKTIVAGFWNSHVHFTQSRVEECRQCAGGIAAGTHAGDADQMGFYHGVGSRLRSA